MTDAWDYDETETDTASGPKPLRDAYKAQREANKELLTRLSSMETIIKQNQIKDLFEDQGVPRSAAKYYSGDATNEGVTAFVNDMRATFGGASPSAPSEQAPTVSDTDISQLQNLMQAGANGTVTGTESAAMQRMSDPSLSQADRIAAFQELARKLQ
jgi:hypothetical protein